MMLLRKNTVRMVFCAVAVVCAIALVPAGANAAAKSFEEKNFDIGIGAGMWFPGTIDIEGTDVDKTGGLLARVFADAYLMPKFAVGAYLNYSSSELEYGGEDVDFTMYEFGVALKPRFLLSPSIALKPGLNIGYRYTEVDITAPIDTSADGLGLNLSVELQFLLDGGYIFFIEGGFLSQPAGGTDDVDVTWAPIMYLAGGIVF